MKTSAILIAVVFLTWIIYCQPQTNAAIISQGSAPEKALAAELKAERLTDANPDTKPLRLNLSNPEVVKIVRSRALLKNREPHQDYFDMDMVCRSLKWFGVTYEEIGVTPQEIDADMREASLRYIKAIIKSVTNAANPVQDRMLDACLVSDMIDLYSITPKELNLTDDELAKMLTIRPAETH